MNAGILLMIAYWVIFTVRKHFTPKLAAATKANTYDLNRGDPEAKELRDIARVLSITAGTDTNIREAMTGILNIADRLEGGKSK